MTDGFTILNPGVSGDVMDESILTYGSDPTSRKRPRVVITGENNADIAICTAAIPTGSEVGLYTRPIVGPYPGTLEGIFNTASSVASDTETVVCTFTVPGSVSFYFLGFAAAGDVNARYRVYFDSAAMVSAITSVANPSAQVSFVYPVLVAATGVVVTLKAIHYVSGVNGNFDGTIFGYTL